MKNIFFSVIILTFVSLFTHSQCCNNGFADFLHQPNYALLPSEYTPSIHSTTEIVNGFDNFKLGVDFAEPYIATNPNNPLNSVCAFVFSRVYNTVDGVNWNSVAAAPGSFSADPFVCYDGLGTVYYVYFLSNIMKIAKSTDQGVSWSNYPIYSGFADKPSIASVQTGGPFENYVYAIWQAPLNDSVYLMQLSKSTNRGLNWSAPVRVNNIDAAYCPWMAIGPNGSVNGGSLYCAYNSFVDNSDTISIWIRRSTNSGNSFLNEYFAAKLFHPPMLKDSIAANACVQMAADNSNNTYRGNVYMVYIGKTSVPDDADVFFIRSTDFGENWSLPRKVNDDNTNTDQWMPSITVDNSTGKIFISWYDSRVDPANNIMTKLFGAVSSDGGTTFSSNTAISTVSFNPIRLVRNFGSQGYMGHYNGISSIGNTSYASWVDGRNNNTMGSYTSYYPDFAVKLDTDLVYLNGNDSGTVVIKVPAVNGPFNDNIKFSTSLDSLPVSGNVSLNFVGKDSISIIPDSVVLKIKTNGVINPDALKIFVRSSGTSNGVPAHIRTINLFVNLIGIENIGLEIPRDYKLYQNYPNPFNPITTFKFDIPMRSFTKLTIFDALGKEIVKLVDTELIPGAYRINWDAVDYSSGIYFYSIKSGDFSAAGKLVLIK